MNNQFPSFAAVGRNNNGKHKAARILTDTVDCNREIIGTSVKSA
jgi:hypothetical protein